MAIDSFFVDAVVFGRERVGISSRYKKNVGVARIFSGGGTLLENFQKIY